MAFKEKFTKLKTEIEDFFKDKGVEVNIEPNKVANLIAFKKGDEELKPEKFEDVTLADGVTTATIEPSIEMGAAIVLQTADTEPIAAPVGEYELQDGRIIVVTQEGEIAEVKEPSMDEEMPEQEPMADDNVESPGKVKSIIESIVKEKRFATEEEKGMEMTPEQKVTIALAEEVVALSKDNESLKSQIKEMGEEFAKTNDFIKDKFTAICEMVGEQPEKEAAVKGKFSQVLAEDEHGNPIIKSIKTA